MTMRTDDRIGFCGVLIEQCRWQRWRKLRRFRWMWTRRFQGRFFSWWNDRWSIDPNFRRRWGRGEWSINPDFLLPMSMSRFAIHSKCSRDFCPEFYMFAMFHRTDQISKSIGLVLLAEIFIKEGRTKAWSRQKGRRIHLLSLSLSFSSVQLSSSYFDGENFTVDVNNQERNRWANRASWSCVESNWYCR